MNFNIFKKLFSFGRSSFSSLASEENTKIEEKNNTKEVACKSPFIIPLKMDPNSFEEYASAFDEKIDVCKEHADPKKYFDLFAKHLKKFDNGGLGKKIALIDLSNIEVDKMIIDLNPKAEYVLIDNFLDYHLLKGLVPDVDLSLICTDDGSILEQFEELQKLNIDMKFDVIVGNPPYDGSLHLKILKKTMEQINETGEVVWLAPARWLQDPLAKYKKNSAYYKYENLISKHLLSFNIINASVSNKMFSIGNFGDLAVYHLTTKKSNFDYDRISREYLGDAFSIIDKILKFNCDVIANHIQKGFEGICVKVAEVRGFGSGKNFDIVSLVHNEPYINGIGYIDKKFKKKDVKSQNVDSELFLSVKTVDEGRNFIKSTRTNFFHFLNKNMKMDQNVPLRFLPYMGNVINPRTSKLGYESDWTDEDFYKYFNLTDDEIKLIEDTIKE